MFITLDWAEPQFGVKTDYDLCILNSRRHSLVLRR